MFPRAIRLFASSMLASVILSFVPLRADAACVDYTEFIRWQGAHPLENSWADESDVALSGNYAYIATSDPGFVTCDLSDPTAPIELDFLDLGRSDCVVARGPVLYVGSLHGRIDVLSLSNPAAPQLVTTLDTPGATRNLTVVFNTLYAADASTLRIYDITNPVSPTLLASVPVQASDVAVSGGYAYVVGSGGGKIIDVSPPAAAHLVGSFWPTPTHSAVAAGGRLYIGSVGTLRIYDLSDPLSPAFLGSVAGENAQVKSVVGDLAYLRTSVGTMVVDVSDPTSPSVQAIAAGQGPFVLGLDVLNGRLVTVGLGIDVFDVNNPSSAPVLASDPNFPPTHASEQFGDHLYTAAGAVGLLVYDLSDPLAPALAGDHPTAAPALDLAIDWPIVCIATELGVEIVDVSSPVQPVLIGTALPGTHVDEVAVEGDRLYAVDGDNVRIVDVSTPASPLEIGVISDECLAFPRRLVASGAALYLIGRRSQSCFIEPWWSLGVWNVSNPSSPSQTYFGGLDSYAFAINGALGYLGTETSVLTLDLSNPLIPVPVATTPARGWGTMRQVGSVLYALQTEVGVEAFDLSDPASPVSLGQSRVLSSADHAVPYGDVIYVTSEDGGLEILPTHCASTVGVTNPAPPSPAKGLSSFPNPARGEARVHFVLETDASVTFRVYDVGGRLTRSVALGPLPAGAGEFVWDGRSETGQPVEAGVYFARLEGAGAPKTARIVLRR